MLRCKSRPRIEEISLAIREGELDFATAAIRYSEAPKVHRVVVLDRSPDADILHSKGGCQRLTKGI